MKMPLQILSTLLSAALVLPLSTLAQSLALVSSEKDDAISVVSLKDLTLQGTIATCKRPRHLQLSPDRKQLMVA